MDIELKNSSICFDSDKLSTESLVELRDACEKVIDSRKHKNIKVPRAFVTAYISDLDADRLRIGVWPELWSDTSGALPNPVYLLDLDMLLRLAKTMRYGSHEIAEVMIEENIRDRLNKYLSENS